MRKLSSWKLGKAVKIAVVVMLFNTLTADVREQVVRAPRDGSSDMAAPNCCAGTYDNSCACDLALLTCCEELTDIVRESFSGTWTAIAAISGDCDLSEVYEDFRETWTVLQRIDTKLFQMNDEVLTIDSKIDELFVDFQETWTAIAASGGECDLSGVYEDFRETWTILGDHSEVAVGGIDTLDEINTSTLSIIAWLKTMYAQSRGLID